MFDDRAIEAIDATDDEIRRAVDDAELPALLAALAHVTGDPTLLWDDVRPDGALIRDPQGGLTPDQQAAARELATRTLIAHRDAGNPAPARPSLDQLHRIMEFAVGSAVDDDYLPLLQEELAVDEDRRAPTWHKDDLDPDRPLRVAVIGAGMSGLAAAHRLNQAGIDHVVLEKNDDIGGTWLENTYPGCRVDVPSHFYSYSFAQKDDWPEYFSSQPVLLQYFRDVADHFGLRDRIRFGTEVHDATWDDERCRWSLTVTGPDGVTDTVEAHALISAVGQLNQPEYPDIDGRDTFAGPAFHSARWDHDVDLTGARVAVIGTGASAAQFVPAIADQAAELTVFQRTPNWYGYTEEYRKPLPDGLLWLFRHVPTYSEWYRFWLYWRMADGLLPYTEVDPDWDRPDSCGPLNEELRALMAMYNEAVVGDDPELLAKMTPHYPPTAKRVIRDDASWHLTMRRDHVHLVTTDIDHIAPDGVVTTDGVHHDADVIVYGTGFRAADFLVPMRVVGRGGVELHDHWDGDARAYLGITIPGFPNLFCLYGPNTNIVVNGSIIYFSECEVHYVLACLRHLLTEQVAAIECRSDVHDAYNARIDAGNAIRAWGVGQVNSWYRNAHGRIAQNWPFSLLEYWQQTRDVDPADYEHLRARRISP